jgi:hypothetical protein
LGVLHAPARERHQEKDLPMRCTERGLASRRLLEALGLICVVSMLVSPLASAASQEDEARFAVIGGMLTLPDPPLLPALGPIASSGKAQVTTATMQPFEIADATGTGSGWRLTVDGEPGAGRSAVFAQYCPNPRCGHDTHGYIAGGETLPAGSLTLTSSGAGFVAQRGANGVAPTLECSAGCSLDGAASVKVASAGADAGMGIWLASGFAPTSLALTTPRTLHELPAEEVYRIDELWSMTSGP